MLHCHESQFYEWLPYNAGYPDQVPQGDDARRAWLAGRMRQRLEPLADRYRDLLVRTYGADHGGRVRLIEAFEVSEYGAPLDSAARAGCSPSCPPIPERPRRSPGSSGLICRKGSRTIGR